VGFTGPTGADFRVRGITGDTGVTGSIDSTGTTGPTGGIPPFLPNNGSISIGESPFVGSSSFTGTTGIDYIDYPTLWIQGLEARDTSTTSRIIDAYVTQNQNTGLWDATLTAYAPSSTDARYYLTFYYL
jgi:hypothetical protein